jgi:hypothetical protein
MPVTNPWLAGPSPARQLGRPRLEERILNLLSSQNMCVLATTGPDGPLATPVRYYHLDFTLLVTAAAGSPKMRNLAADPRISAGIFAPLVGQASSRGAQIFGMARVLTADDADFGQYWPAYRWQSDHAERPVAGRATARAAAGHQRAAHRLHRALAPPRRVRAAPVLVS